MEQNIDNEPQAKKKKLFFSNLIYICTLPLLVAQIFCGIKYSGLSFYPTITFNEQLFNENRHEIWTMIIGTIICLLAMYHYKKYLDVIEHISSNKIFANQKLQSKYENIKIFFNRERRFNSWEIWDGAYLFFPCISLTPIIFLIFGITDWLLVITIALVITEFVVIFCFVKDRLSKDIYKRKIVVKIKMRYSNKNANLQSIIKYLNSDLILGVGCIFYFILSAICIKKILFFSIFSEIYYLGLYSIILLVGISKVYTSTRAYRVLIKAFNDKKRRMLEELEKQDDISSMYLYDKLQEKEILSTKDKITLPIKVLISPTLMEYLRIKIVAPDDLNFIINYFLGIMG